MKKYAIILIVNELRNNLQNKCSNKKCKNKAWGSTFLLIYYAFIFALLHIKVNNLCKKLRNFLHKT